MLYFESISDLSSDIGSYSLAEKAFQIYFKKFLKLMLEMISNENFY